MQSRKSPTRAFKRFHLCVKPGHGVDWMMVLMRMSMICWFAGGKEWRSGWMVVHQVCGHEVDKYKVSLVQTTFYWIALTLSQTLGQLIVEDIYTVCGHQSAKEKCMKLGDMNWLNQPVVVVTLCPSFFFFFFVVGRLLVSLVVAFPTALDRYLYQSQEGQPFSDWCVEEDEYGRHRVD